MMIKNGVINSEELKHRGDAIHITMYAYTAQHFISVIDQSFVDYKFWFPVLSHLFIYICSAHFVEIPYLCSLSKMINQIDSDYYK
jgi:hypothetical protein